MIAVIKTGGKQYLVKAGDEIKVEKLPIKTGQVVTMEEVLLTADGEGKNLKAGQPNVANAKVECTVLEQGRHPKVTTVKYKSKVRYRRQKGHRQAFTLLKVNKITA
jgi:large subunit ribosomal protein L21